MRFLSEHNSINDFRTHDTTIKAVTTYYILVIYSYSLIYISTQDLKWRYGIERRKCPCLLERELFDYLWDGNDDMGEEKSLLSRTLYS